MSTHARDTNPHDVLRDAKALTRRRVSADPVSTGRPEGAATTPSLTKRPLDAARSSITLAQLLRDSAARRPDHVAVEDPDRGSSITYRELDTRSDEISRMLVRRGVRPGDRVGVYAPKSVDSVAAIFGILKARAVYVPVDAGAPPARNAGIFADCSVKAVFVASPLADGLRAAWQGVELPAVEEPADGLLLLQGLDDGVGESADTTAQEGEPTDLAYILYTSGSTGRPKGVVHTNASGLSFVDWCSEALEPNENDRFSSHAPFHFDLSILDLYLPIKHGATVVLVGEEVGKQPLGLATLISNLRLSVWYSTPSILRLLTDFGRMARFDYSSLRLVLFAGEVFPIKHLRALKGLWPHPRYFNLYGPTETNVCTYFEVPAEIPESRTTPMPIGWTCENDRARVVDEDGSEVPFGSEGELCISGGTVMQGYWNLPERSERAFLNDASGARWYRTGDVVRETRDEGYVYVGRRDRMVKRRGYRVELGEIEAALYRHPAVTEAAAVAARDEQGDVRIDAYLACADGQRRSLIEMKTFCSENLPMYMVPDRFVFRDRLPKTSTDKIDYQRLTGE